MRRKPYGILVFLVSFLFHVTQSASAQEYVAKKFGVKIGYVMPTWKNVQGPFVLDPAPGTTWNFKIKDEFKGGFGIGIESYLASNPKSEIVIGVQWARTKREVTEEYDFDKNGTYDDSVSDSANGNWLHIPVTYKFKFSQSEDGTGAYLGAGISYLTVKFGDGSLPSPF